MTTNPQGLVELSAGGNNYKLFLGMSVLAELQDKHGSDVLNRLEAPEGAPEGWTPDFNIINDLFLGALQRFHADVADRWLVDDLIAENAHALPRLMGASFPDAPKNGEVKSSQGKAKGPKKAA